MGSELPFIPYNATNKAFARFLRSNATLAEKTIWEALLRKKQTGYKFIRQKPIGSFIVDFYCAQLRLAIEIDGKIHDQQLEYDEERSLVLEKFGILVIRYSNEQILNQLDKVKSDLNAQIAKRAELL